jgi:hypothetical protein
VVWSENDRRWCLGGGGGGCRRWVAVGMRVWVFREVRDEGEGRGLLYGRWERMGNGGGKVT